ncbi:hypothetical protein CAURIC_01165 [Corynebacterium auriscanis]|nr:hypothetical protein CAURIC_01165 [Corynebacterium auriscanis]
MRYFVGVLLHILRMRVGWGCVSVGVRCDPPAALRPAGWAAFRWGALRPAGCAAFRWGATRRLGGDPLGDPPAGLRPYP